MSENIFVLGSFVADVAMWVPRLPSWGETLMGSGLMVGPGGKGSNQAVAAARAGGRVQLLSAVGRDAFGELAWKTWAAAGVDASLVRTVETATGAAMILVDKDSGENAIAISPGACATLSAADIEACSAAIAASRVFVAQLELPLPVVAAGLRVARAAGVRTVLNPAPAPEKPLTEEVLGLCDFVIPNETEAAHLSGVVFQDARGAAEAAAKLQARGAGDVVVTLGAKGALLCRKRLSPVLVAAFQAGVCVDTTGAGDAFCGALAVALAEGAELEAAVRFGCAGAGRAVTRQGTAMAMPTRAEIEALLG